MKQKQKEKTVKRTGDLGKQMSIKKFLHAQFIKIGAIVGVVLAVLGIFTIYLGVELSEKNADKYNTSVGTQIVFTVAIVVVIVVGCILLVDLFLRRIVVKTINRISEPIQVLDEAIGKLASGTLDENIEYTNSDEFTNIIENTSRAMSELKKYVGNISDTLLQISEKNMNIGIDEEYVGDFVEIRTSMLNIIDSLNEMLSQMRTSFTQVRDGPVLWRRRHRQWRMEPSSSRYISTAYWGRLKKYRRRFMKIRWPQRGWRSSRKLLWNR